MKRIFITAGTTAGVTIAQIISPFAYAILHQVNGMVVIPIVMVMYHNILKLLTLNIFCAIISFHINNFKIRFYLLSISAIISLVALHFFSMEVKWSDAIFSPYGWLLVAFDLIVFVGALSIGWTARRTAHLRGLAVDLMLPAALT